MSIEKESIERCIVSGMPLTKGKAWKKCHSRVVYKHLKEYNHDLAAAKARFKDYTYVEELDTFYRSWHDCSKGIGKGGHTLDKKHLYEKYFQIKCRLNGCNEDVPFEMTGKNACCTLHYNQSIKHVDRRADAKFICLETGNKFLTLKSLSKYIKSIGMELKDYYDKHYKKDDAEGKCKWCSTPVGFENIQVGYKNFCYNTDCNVNWYNKHENRAANCADKISATHRIGDRLPSQIGYWVKRGFSEEEGYKKVRETQSTNSVEDIMKRKNCSLDEAIAIRAEITDKWLKSFPKSNFSKISQELFQSVYNIIKNDYREVYFASLKGGYIVDDNKNHEYRVKTHRSSRKLDFYIKDINKCIEFDGTYWHGLVGKGDKTKELSREMEIIQAIKCDILHVKEEDYRKNKEVIVERCVNFLNKSNG